MNWSLIATVVVVLAVFLGLKRLSFVSADVARKYLREGAIVVDVRSPEEFRSGHVSGALNIPLGELRESLPRAVSDKNRVLLLHCLSGGRSGVAKVQIKRMGYQHAFNLGSYSRAQAIVNGARTR